MSLDDIALPQANLLLAYLETRLTAQPNVPAQFCLRVGEVAMELDECCAGLAYVKITSIYPSDVEFPSPRTDSPVTGCGITAWGVELEMGVLRCAPTGTQMKGPTCTEWTTIAGQVADDARAMRMALCDFIDHYDPNTLAVGSWGPIDPQGGCTGGVQSVTVQIPACECE